MSNTFPQMTADEARDSGYRSLTRPYRTQHQDDATRNRERDWWHNVCSDLRCCDCVIVLHEAGPEIWRHENQLDIDPKTGFKIPKSELTHKK